MHDECNGSDVFGSDICTCRPYLAHGIEECIETAQEGGVGLIVYNRKEGRALGEVTKFLVYNARKRQDGGDRADAVLRAHRVRRRRAGHALPGADAGRAALARHPRIDRFVSMSNMKYDADRRAAASRSSSACAIPDELIPADARVEMDAKKAAGYFTPERCPTRTELATAKGRRLDE